MHLKRQNIYLACEDMDFVWDERDVAKFQDMWREGLGLKEIAEAFKRDPDEVGMLVMDQARKGLIKPRKKVVNGRRYR